MKKNNEYLVSILSKLLLILLSFVNSILINRYLGAELRGEYAFILNASNIFTIIMGFNIATSYPYFSKVNGANVIKRFINIIFLQTGIYIMGAIISSFYLKNELIVAIIAISVVLQFANQLDFISIILNVNKRNKIMVISAVINTATLIYLYFFTKSNLGYIVGALLLYNVFRITVYIFKYKLLPSKDSQASLPLLQIINFSFFSMITSLFTIFNYNIDVIILKLFVENREVGLYSVGVTLASMMWIIPDAFKDVLFNKTAKNDSIDAIVFSIKINVYLSLFVITGFVFVGKAFITMAYGIEYRDAYYISVVLLIGTMPMIFFKMINTLYHAIGKQKYSFNILLISVLLNIVSSFIIIPMLGIMGAAASTVGSYMICGIIMLVSFMKKYNLSFKGVFLFNDYEKNIVKRLIVKKL